MEITKDHSNENMQKLFRACYTSESTNIICIKQSQIPWEKLCSGKRGRLHSCPDRRLLAQGRTDKEWEILCDQLGEHIWLFLVGSKLKAGTKNQENQQLLTKS